MAEFVILPKETTFFAIGGKGYYENPASEILAFFLKPDGAHNLGNLFLSTYLELCGLNQLCEPLDNVQVNPQSFTKAKTWIDIEIIGVGWCLIIENKIYHWLANPLDTYEKHAQTIGSSSLFFHSFTPVEITK